MTVYVDDMYKYPMGEFRGMKMSHMIATDEEELHRMADTIGVRRKWYQGDHYDISLGMRVKAIEAGAVSIGLRDLSSMVMVHKATGKWVKPGVAQDTAYDLLTKKRLNRGSPGREREYRPKKAT